MLFKEIRGNLGKLNENNLFRFLQTVAAFVGEEQVPKEEASFKLIQLLTKVQEEDKEDILKIFEDLLHQDNPEKVCFFLFCFFFFLFLFLYLT